MLTYANTDWEIGKLEYRKMRIVKIRIADFSITTAFEGKG